MAVLSPAKGLFIPCCIVIPEVMPYHQADLRQQLHHIIHRGLADVKVLLQHGVKEIFNLEVILPFVDLFQYPVTLLRFP
ncbi:hypothetical protein D9M69_626360 [compost metagenome]